MSVTLFKDYHRQTKDILTKYSSKPGEFKLESKLKAGYDQAVLNPTASNDGRVSCDMEYKFATHPLSVKATLSSAATLTKITATAEHYPHMVEVIFDPKSNEPEVKYELKNKMYSLANTVSKKAADAFVSVKAYPGLFLGAGAIYSMDKKQFDFLAGACYSQAGYVFDILSSPNFRSFTAGFVAPLKVNNGKYQGTLGLELGFQSPKNYIIKGGVETSCFIIPKNKVKICADSHKMASLTYVATFPAWKMAATVNSNRKIGATFILE